MIGTTLGAYRLVAELGSGGMGKVYRAKIEGRVPGLAAGTTVALKVVHPHLLETPGFFKRFLREAEIGKSVRHENVVRTFDCDAVLAGGAQHHFLVMEYVEGQTLRSLLEELGRVPEELCRHIGRETAKGLAAIHATGVIHRDMKPENVLITKEHVVKVMDLGVARLHDEALRLSQTGAFVGSIPYAAPECFTEDGKGVDGRADLHALGLVLYELASGVNPYLADGVPQTLHRILHDEPRRCAEINPQLSPFFEEVVHNLLAKRREARFASAAELATVLDEGERSAWWISRAKAIRLETKRPLRRIRIPRETALYGRDAELAKLRAIYEKAKVGEGQVALVEGEAGIGKTRLVDEFVGLLQREGEDLNFLFGSYPPGGAATASGAFSTAYREQFGAESMAETLLGYLQATPLLVPAFAALLTGDATPTSVEPLTKDSLQTCFVHATRGLAAERTTIVLIDDLHFAPEEGRSLFAALAMAVPGHRIVLVGTTRPGGDEKWLSSLDRIGATRIAPQRLGPKDLGRLLIDTLKSARLAEELAGKIGIKSDGNPYFVFEILRGMREGQFITRRDDGTWVGTRVIADIQIPSSILELVQARLGDLEEEEKDLLDVAACCGFEFDPLLVASALGMAQISAMKRFGRIERKHRLVRSAGRRMVFDHHQIQESIYGGMLELLREPYHAAIAEALEAQHGAAGKDPSSLDGALCVDIAEHFFEGARGPHGLRYLDAALSHLEKGYLNDAAIRLADRALAVPGLVLGKARSELLLRKSARLNLLGRRDEQAKCLEEARTLADASGDSGLKARARSAMGWHLVSTSRLDAAQRVLAEALAFAREAGDRKEEAAATGSLGVALSYLGRYPEAQVQFDRALALTQESGDRQGEASAAGNLGAFLVACGRLPEAQAQNERALLLAREVGNRRSEAIATGNLGSVFGSLGRYTEAQEKAERRLALARELGDRQGEAIAAGLLGNALSCLGLSSEAQAKFEQYLALAREIGDRQGEGYALAGLGSVADDMDDTAHAMTRMEESLALRRAIGHGDGIAESLVLLGGVRRRTGDTEGARAALEEAVTLSREQGQEPEAALAQAVLACLPGGDASGAEAMRAEIGERGRSPQVSLLLWQATHDRAHLVEAKRLLDEALVKVPAEHQATMLQGVRVNREITAAAREQSL